MVRKNREVFRGPSEFNGEPVVAVAGSITTPSKNAKTGPMVQLSVLPTEKNPSACPRTPEDRCRKAVCGTCPIMERCYVIECKAPSSQWRSWQRGSYEVNATDPFPRPVRFGMWGDCAALPPAVMASLVGLATKGWTGYTEAWRERPDLRASLMASVHSEAEAREAWALGWRTFRTLEEGEENAPNEITCPSATRGAKCATCLLCNGAREGDCRKSITIPYHGANA